MPGFGPVVREIIPNQHIPSGGEADTWCLSVESTREGATRLISRWRRDWPKTIGTRVWIAIADRGASVMEQKMLRTIRDLAERNGRRTSMPWGDPQSRASSSSGRPIR